MRTEILRSGFPGIRGLPERAVRAQLDSYLQRIVDRDLPELGQTARNPAGLCRWLAAYAAATATTTSFETIRDAATAGEADKPAKATATRYRDALERLFVLDPVSARHSRRAGGSRSLRIRPSTISPIPRSPRGSSGARARPCSGARRPARRCRATAPCSARCSSRS